MDNIKAAAGLGRKKKVILCHGVFDLLHIGHVVHLREARQFGDWLVVSVVPDKHVWKPKRPLVFKESDRVVLLKALRDVDEVFLCDGPGPESLIERLKPSVYVRGPDYVGKEMPEGAILKELGIEVRYTPSSYPRTTEIIERIRNEQIKPRG